MTKVLNPSDRMTQQKEVVNDPDPREVPELVNRYISQLVNGCGDQKCTETLCRTGMLNTSFGKPVRKYNTRSARTIAISMCASPKPRSHLCKYIAAGSTKAKATIQETRDPVDPSALDQQLSETKSFQSLHNQVTLCAHDIDLKAHHDAVTKLLKADAHELSLSANGFVSNRKLVDEMIPGMEWLLAKLPLQRPASFKMVDELISKGYAYPPKNASAPVDESFNNWLTILDTIHHKPYLRLLGRIMEVLVKRQKVEGAVRTSRSAFGSELFASPPQSRCVTLFLNRLLAPRDTTAVRFCSLILWLKRIFAEHWDGRPFVNMGTVCMGALSMLMQIAATPLSSSVRNSVSLYSLPIIWVRLTTTELVQSYCEYLSGRVEGDSLHVFTFTPLFSLQQLTLCFRALNHITMRTAHSQVDKSLNLTRRYENSIDEDAMPEQSRHATRHYLLLNVSRGKILHDTFDQLWHRRKDELKRPLRVRLGEVDEHEIGHDLGGVQIEFFNIVCKEVFSEEAQMFVTDSESGISYFRPGSLQPLYMFELVGLLIALALYNGITLPISLPIVFYRILTSKDITAKGPHALDTIRDGWPVIAKSLESVLKEHVEGLEFAFPFEANGIRMQTLMPERTSHATEDQERDTLQITSAVPKTDIQSIATEIPGWKLEKATTSPADVEPWTRELYVLTQVQYIVNYSVAPQWRAFKKGFYESGILHPRHLQLFDPIQLKAILEGTSRLDIAALRAITRYEGYNPSESYMHSFWRVVGSWSEAKQKQLLKFVTAAERIPITGGLTFIIKKQETENKERLPTSSTCFGTLMLPVYRSERVLREKLGLALKYGTEGFGTG